jgi:hypothetical protein
MLQKKRIFYRFLKSHNIYKKYFDMVSPNIVEKFIKHNMWEELFITTFCWSYSERKMWNYVHSFWWKFCEFYDKKNER